jgi:hypothetical protein
LVARGQHREPRKQPDLRRRPRIHVQRPAQEGEPLAAFYGQATTAKASRPSRAGLQARALVRLYAANRYLASGGLSGQQADDAWLERTLARLQAWGFNTLGNWSEPAFARPRRMPYSLPLSIVGDLRQHQHRHGLVGRMPDPFDPRRHGHRARRGHCHRDHRDDPG